MEDVEAGVEVPCHCGPNCGACSGRAFIRAPTDARHRPDSGTQSRDPPVQLGILQEYKAEGRVRYIGITTTSGGRYPDLAEVMREYPLDFIGIDYAIDNRAAADMIFPLAQELGIAVMVYLPFGRNRLWSRVEGRDVPEWAADFGATTWAQFFLKFAIAHPAVTVVTPGTSNAEHMLDNVTAQTGRIPNEDEIARMVDVVDELPPPPPRRRGGF